MSVSPVSLQCTRKQRFKVPGLKVKVVVVETSFGSVSGSYQLSPSLSLSLSLFLSLSLSLSLSQFVQIINKVIILQ